MDGANKRLRDSFRVSLGKYYALATVLYFTLSSGTVEATCYVSTCSIFSLIVARKTPTLLDPQLQLQ